MRERGSSRGRSSRYNCWHPCNDQQRKVLEEADIGRECREGGGRGDAIMQTGNKTKILHHEARWDLGIAPPSTLLPLLLLSQSTGTDRLHHPLSKVFSLLLSAHLVGHGYTELVLHITLEHLHSLTRLELHNPGRKHAIQRHDHQPTS